MLQKLLLICGALLWCALRLPGQVPGQDGSAKLQSRLGKLVDSRFPGTRCPGFSVAVAQNNAIIFSKALGAADLEQNVPLSVGSVHRLASVSKVVTGTIIMDLVQTGRLRLDAAVRTYLPELPASYGSVTIRHLLSHQAGVGGYRDIEEVFSATHYATSRSAVNAFADDPLLFEPGTKVEYSTFGFTLLGAAAEAVAGKPFEDVSRDFFARHGLKGFDIDDTRALVSGRVRGYLVDSGGQGRQGAERALLRRKQQVPGGRVHGIGRGLLAVRYRRGDGAGAEAKFSGAGLDPADDCDGSEEPLRLRLGRR